MTNKKNKKDYLNLEWEANAKELYKEKDIFSKFHFLRNQIIQDIHISSYRQNQHQPKLDPSRNVSLKECT